MMPPSILRALWMALGSFLHPIILWHMLWPVLVGICLWFVVFFGGWWLIEPLMTPYLHEGASVLPQWLLNLGRCRCGGDRVTNRIGFFAPSTD